jgi:hypothetical protein
MFRDGDVRTWCLLYIYEAHDFPKTVEVLRDKTESTDAKVCLVVSKVVFRFKNNRLAASAPATSEG